MNFTIIFGIAALGVSLGFWGIGCSPKVYLIDRHTVMEEEAAGEWPDFEKSLLETSSKMAPTPFKKTEISGDQKKLYQVLNGELTL